jgi:hypothetical protein
VFDSKILDSPWAWVIGGILISTWLLGVIHAYSSHSRFSAAGAVIVPPYGLYMALEQMAAHPDAGPTPVSSTADALPVDAEGGYLDQCLQKRVMSDQLSLGEIQNQVFCTCSAQMLADGIPAGEDEYVAKYGENSPEFMTLRRTVSESCLDSARAVGALDAD